MSDVSKIIERMIQASESKNMSQMLESMGFSDSSGSAWKRRGKIPDGSIAKVSELTGVSFVWLKTGEGEMRKSEIKHPLLPTEVAELVAKHLTGYEAKGRELSEGAVMLGILYDQMSQEDQGNILLLAAGMVHAKEEDKAEE